MTSHIVSPLFDVDTARDIVRNNQSITYIKIEIETNDTWLPQILTDTGFFPSNGQCKKNRFDLWRELEEPGVYLVEFPWADVTVRLIEGGAQ